MQFAIHKALPEDARDIQNVFYKTWLATYPNEEYGITREDIEDRYKDRLTDATIEKRKESIGSLKDGESMLVAKAGESVIGVCYLKKFEGKNQLGAIYVIPEYQGRGIGQMFWAEAKKFFDPDQPVFVEVAVYNQPAINFYRRLGFEDTGRRFSDERFKMKNGSVIPEMEMVLKAV